jgi:hypothetical protein
MRFEIFTAIEMKVMASEYHAASIFTLKMEAAWTSETLVSHHIIHEATIQNPMTFIENNLKLIFKLLVGKGFSK